MPHSEKIELDELLAKQMDSLAAEGAPVVFWRNGRPIAALVAIDDPGMLEKLEDFLDAEEAERRLKDPNEGRIPFEEVRRELGLE